MGYNKVALEDKILEMYPEISKHGISVGLVFDEQKNAYIVKFTRINMNLQHTLRRKMLMIA
jgi:hypothetical protein